MLPALWRTWQRKREEAALRRRAIPDDLWKRTLVRYPFLKRRAPEAAAELRRLTSLFLDRKEFSAAGDLRLSDAMVVAIAAQATLPVLKLGITRYDSFVGIVVHPTGMVRRQSHQDEDGVVHEYDDFQVGQAMEGGPMTLSWHDVRDVRSRGMTGYNVVIHEFAHVLDMADGLADGVPLLSPPLTRASWLKTLEAEYDAFARRIEAAEAAGDEDTLASCAIDPYGASAIDEFFACASESFFVSAAQTQAEHPALYALLAAFYGQDPALETAGAHSPPTRSRRIG